MEKTGQLTPAKGQALGHQGLHKEAVREHGVALWTVFPDPSALPLENPHLLLSVQKCYSLGNFRRSPVLQVYCDHNPRTQVPGVIVSPESREHLTSKS